MSNVYLVVLAVEVEEGQGNPSDWDWATLIDSPLPVDVVRSIETDERVSVVNNLRRLAARWEV